MIRLVKDDLRPPGGPPKRHLLSVGDLTRDDVERLLGTARTFENSLERHVKKLPTLKAPGGGDSAASRSRRQDTLSADPDVS
jgi:hypothetical protein